MIDAAAVVWSEEEEDVIRDTIVVSALTLGLGRMTLPWLREDETDGSLACDKSWSRSYRRLIERKRRTLPW